MDENLYQGVRIADVYTSNPWTNDLQPRHPHANEDGMVEMPNVDVLGNDRLIGQSLRS